MFSFRNSTPAQGAMRTGTDVELVVLKDYGRFAAPDVILQNNQLYVRAGAHGALRRCRISKRKHSEKPRSNFMRALTPEFATGLREVMLQGLAREMETTKKVLAAVPESGRNYRPDPKARPAWDLAWHLASADVQMLDEIADHKFALEPRFKTEPANVAALVKWYDDNFKRALERVRAMSAADLGQSVDFYGVFNHPVVFYLSFVNNHSIHPRAQLSVYLRPMGSKVPSIYGGSADEPWP